MVLMKYKKSLKLLLFIAVLNGINAHAMIPDDIEMSLTRASSAKASLNFSSWKTRFNGTKEKACYSLLLETLSLLKLNPNAQSQIDELGVNLYAVDDLTVPSLISNFLREQKLINAENAKEIVHHRTVEGKIINITHFLAPKLFKEDKMLEIPGFGTKTEREFAELFSFDTTFALHRRTYQHMFQRIAERRNTALKLLSELVWFNANELGGINGPIKDVLEVTEGDGNFHIPLFTQDKLPALINELSNLSNKKIPSNLSDSDKGQLIRSKELAKSFSILTRLWANTNSHAITQHNEWIAPAAASIVELSLIPLAFAAYYGIGHALDYTWANNIHDAQHNINDVIPQIQQETQTTNVLLAAMQTDITLIKAALLNN